MIISDMAIIHYIDRKKSKKTGTKIERWAKLYHIKGVKIENGWLIVRAMRNDVSWLPWNGKGDRNAKSVNSENDVTNENDIFHFERFKIEDVKEFIL